MKTFGYVGKGFKILGILLAAEFLGAIAGIVEVLVTDRIRNR